MFWRHAMVFRVKNILMIFLLSIIGLVGWKTYSYFFDTEVPILVISGLNNGSYYCGDVRCGFMSNKVGAISVWLDGNVLVSNTKLYKQEQEQSFTIPTKTLSQGEHVLKAEFIDTTFHKNKTTAQRSFYIDNVALQAAFVRPDAEYKVFQGRTLHVQFQVNKEIKEAKVQALANTYDCFPEAKNSSVYECFIPITCEENSNEYLLSVNVTDYVGNTARLDNKFQIVPFPFKKQVLHVSADKVKEEKELGLSQSEFDHTIEEITQNSPQEKLWHGVFCAPIDIVRTTCEFGTIRTTQEKGRYMHKALDIINAPKSVVWATQDGIIALKERYAASGNTVVIDHGWGMVSLFFHLDNFADIQAGQKIAKGNPIGTIGKTGYATGYHLHWETRINNIQVDPLQWTKPNF